MPTAIRMARPEDAEAIVRIYTPFVTDTAVSFEAVAPSADEMRTRIVDTLAERPWLVCEQSGEILGYAYATSHRMRAAYQWAVETSVYVDPNSRRRGVARGLYESLLRILVCQGYVNACAGIALPNPASVALHEACGFQPVGVYRAIGYKLGAWHDVGWWQLSLRHESAAPTPPAPLVGLLAQPELAHALSAGVGFIRI